MRLLASLAALMVLVAGLAGTPANGAQAAIPESVRQVPVAYDVDVVVVGGSTGGVAAAVAAAQAGAKVFLAAPRPYLGEDICATMRLFLEPGETPASPLAKAVFAPEAPGMAATSVAAVPSLPFKYTTDVPSGGKHADSKPPAKLADGIIGASNKDSVEYAGDVVITADLGSVQEIGSAQVIAFLRVGDYDMASVTVETSDDNKAWKPVGTTKVGQGEGETVAAIVPVNAKARYARLTVKVPADTKRLLLAEVALTPGSKAPPAAPAAPAAPEAAAKPIGPVRPIMAKKALDDALLAAKVEYLYGCYATEVLRDAAGNLCGIAMANKAGRQVVRAKVIIDATDRAWVARMAGAQFQPFAAGPQTFTRIIVGGDVREGPGVSGRKVGLAYSGAVSGKPAELIEYTLQIPMADGSWASYALAEQKARDMTFSEGQQIDTDEIFQVPSDPMKAVKAGATAADLDAFRPAGVARLYVVGGCADLPRGEAAKLLRPLALMDAGARVGAAAAAEAKKLPAAMDAKVAMPMAAGAAAGDVKEILGGVRPSQKTLATVPTAGGGLPVLATVDVVVVGGGTGGAPAGIAAARNKAKTLVVEYLHGLGGVGTLGMISKYYWGYRDGFTKEGPLASASWDPRVKAEWWRTQIRQAGGDIWFGVLGCGAYVDAGRVRGVVVATPQGRGVILANTVIDSTGSSDIAAAAGAATTATGGDELAMQGTGLPPIKLGAQYTNTDFTITDETDVKDIWHLFVYAKSKYPNAFDLGQLIDTRERRRIVGDFTMTVVDQVLARTYPDTIHLAYSNFDSHGYTVDSYMLMEHPDKKGFTCNVPYRCLLPKGLDGIIVTGLGISVHRDAVPVTRMEPDIQNQGYAVGLIAASVAKGGRSTRSVDIRDVQRQLVKMNIVPERVLTDNDSFPLPPAKVAEAVASLKDDYKGAAIVLAQPQDALPLLKKAYAAAADEKTKLIYAHTLGLLGDASGLAQLVAAFDVPEWDKGWNYKGMGQFGSSMSRQDGFAVALGRTRDKRALPILLKRAAQLDTAIDFSHHRAMALALEAIGDPSAAPVLAAVLAKPGMAGHAHTNVEQARQLSGTNPIDTTTRQTSLRELFIARALYRCGDQNGLGKKILSEYAHDLRGHIARHAQAVLDEKK